MHMPRSTPSQADAMRRVPLLSALSDAELDELVRLCKRRQVPPGAQIISPAQQADCFYVILSGRVKVFKLSARGDEQILPLFGPGDTFGEAAMWAGGNFPACAEALEETSLLVIRRKTLSDLIERNPEID